jgi:hypothetical protein
MSSRDIIQQSDTVPDVPGSKSTGAPFILKFYLVLRGFIPSFQANDLMVSLNFTSIISFLILLG